MEKKKLGPSMKTQRFPNTDAHTRALAQRIKARLAYWDWLPEIPSSLLNGCWHSDVSGAPWRRDEWPRLGVRLVAAGVGGADRGGKWGRRRAVGWGGGDGCRGCQVEGGVGTAGGGVSVRDVPLKKKKERGRQNTREPRGPLPHLFFRAWHHAGTFNLRNQSRDVMGCDSPFLTRSAVDLTLSRSGHRDGSHAEKVAGCVLKW